MDETIGVKGGKNDRRRSLFITKQQKKQLEQYKNAKRQTAFTELEKKVKLQQRITFLKILPIITLGQIYTSLANNQDKQKNLNLQELIYRLRQENIFSEREIAEIINALQQVKVSKLNNDILQKLEFAEKHKQVSKINITEFNQPENNTILTERDSISLQTPLKPAEELNQLSSNSVNNQSFKQPHISEEAQPLSTSSMDDEISKLKNHAIIAEYEKSLKEIRIDLKKISFDYEVISKTMDTTTSSKEAENLLVKLNTLIKKIDELKSKIAIDNLAEYDVNYLTFLVSNYLTDFANQNIVEEIKDSKLYIDISTAVKNLDLQKNLLQEKLVEKKQNLALTEEAFSNMQEKVYSYENINNKILALQAQQDALLKDIRKQLSATTDIKEKANMQIKTMNLQLRTFMRLISLSMMLPGVRSSRSLVTMAALYLYFMRSIMNPQTSTQKYRTIAIVDCHKEIEKSLQSITDATVLLTKTSKQIDKTIAEFRDKFSDYLNVIPECKELLNNLEKLKAEISEKEIELESLKSEQEKNLEKNDAKVKEYTYDN